jgi:hypothetical protein
VGTSLKELAVVLQSSHREELLYSSCDGDVRSLWSTFAGQEVAAFFQVDLLVPMEIRGVRFYMGKNSDDYPRGASVLVSGDGTAWRRLEGVRRAFMIDTRGGDGWLTDHVGLYWDPITTRLIRVELTTRCSKRWWSIAEAELLVTVPARSVSTSRQTADLKPRMTLERLARRGTSLVARVRVKNQSSVVWLRDAPLGVGTVRLAFRWFKGDTELPGSRRVYLPSAVFPGDERVVETKLEIPTVPGGYTLRIDVVDEGLAWLPGGIAREVVIE